MIAKAVFFSCYQSPIQAALSLKDTMHLEGPKRKSLRPRFVRCSSQAQVTTYTNIDNFRRQLKMLGFSYDWERELATTGKKERERARAVFAGFANESYFAASWDVDVK